MRFQLCVIDDGRGLASDDEMATISAFNERMAEAGYREFAGGLAGPDHSLLIDNRSGVPEIEVASLMAPIPYYAGFWIINVPDVSVAQELAIEASKVCNRRIELREFLGA